MSVAEGTRNESMSATALRASADATSCLTSNLGWLLGQANHAFGCEVSAALAPLGLGSRGYCVLQTALGGEYTQTQLAGMIGLDKTTMVVTVDELERQGLAARTPSATDRRARVIKVTKAGRRKVDEGRRIVDSVQQDVLDALPPSQRETLLEALTGLVSDRLGTAPQCHPPVRRREPRG
jgi:MarR family transcriptional regulator, transcriptional regulator for hemolysin